MAWAVDEVRDNKLQHTHLATTRNMAIKIAIGLAEKDGLIREDEAGEDFMGLSASWTRDELREKLDKDGFYEDGEVKVSIRKV